MTLVLARAAAGGGHAARRQRSGGWAGVPFLTLADVQVGRPEVDLVPAQIYQLGHSQAVPVSDEDHGRVPVAPAVARGRLDEPHDLDLGQMLPGPQLRVGPAAGHDCS